MSTKKKRTKFDDLDPQKEITYFESREERAWNKSASVQQEFFERAVSAAWMAHKRGKDISAPAIVSEDPGLPLRPVRLMLDTPRFRDAMKRRGIPGAEVNTVTPEMMHLIALLADASLMVSERTKVQRLGIDWAVYQGWKDYPPFEAELRRQSEKGLQHAVTLGDAKLAELIAAGNLNAITYANMKTGRFDPASRQMQSVSYIMSMALTIIQKRVTDEATLIAIANDFARLAEGTGLAQAEPLMLEATVEERDEQVYPPLSGDDAP